MSLPLILHENRLDDAAPVASTTAAGYDVLNLRDFRPYTLWKPTALPATVTVDCGSAKAADYAAVYNHTLGTCGCTLEIRGSTDNFSASNVLVASQAFTDDLPRVIPFSSVSYRYWRLRITGGATMPEIAIAAIGLKLEMPQEMMEPFGVRSRELHGAVNRSQSGHPLGNLALWREVELELAWNFLSRSFVRDTFLAAWEVHLEKEPFLFAWEPTTYPKEVWLLSAASKLEAPDRAGGRQDIKFQARGALP